MPPVASRDFGFLEEVMRAEALKLSEGIKEALVLLRRSL
jgi:hypothetical protein